MVNTNSHYHRSYEIFSTAARWLIEIWSIEPGHSFFQTSKAVESPRTASEGFNIVSTSHISNYSSHSAEELVIYPINNTTTFSPTYPTPVSRPYCYSWPISNPSPSYSSRTHPRPSPLPTAQKRGTESALWSPNLKPQRRKQCRDSYSSVLLGIKSPSRSPESRWSLKSPRRVGLSRYWKGISQVLCYVLEDSRHHLVVTISLDNVKTCLDTITGCENGQRTSESVYTWSRELRRHYPMALELPWNLGYCGYRD